MREPLGFMQITFQESSSYAFFLAYPAKVALRYLMATCFFFGTEIYMLALKEGYIGLLLQVMRRGDKPTWRNR